jgi:hypothetical protein
MKSKEDSLKLLQKLITQRFLGKKGRYPAKEKRHTECLKNPERIHKDKDEWFIYVPSCFNDCLDIAKTGRVVKTGCLVLDEKTQKMKPETKIEKVWTQGSRFAFHRGCTLYDTPKAYHRWGDAINEIKYCVSIHSGTNAEPAMNGKERIPGIVEFSILSPSTRTTSLKEIGSFTLTQDEFMSLLINGNPEIISK